MAILSAYGFSLKELARSEKERKQQATSQHPKKGRGCFPWVLSILLTITEVYRTAQRTAICNRRTEA
jgi:hypothetical protein